MIILKFGGTSVKDAQAIANVVSIVKNYKEKCIVVVSALSKVTDILVNISKTHQEGTELAKNIELLKQMHYKVVDDLKLYHQARVYIDMEINKITKICSKEVLENSDFDEIQSKGEVLSSFLVSQAFIQFGERAALLDSRNCIITDSNFSSANPQFELTKIKVNEELQKFDDGIKFYICGGFIGRDENQNVTTLGRGGSDYSAAIYAMCVEAERLEIWTDVDGILTCDPRMIADAKRILKLSYTEASELAYFGAKVLHPKTIHPAVEKNIPVVVKNTYNPENSGTWIENSDSNTKILKAIAFRKNITVINIISNRMLGAFGFLSKVFEVFKNHETSVDLVATSEVSISLTIDDISKIDQIRKDLEAFSAISVSNENAIISIVGEGIKETAGIAARFFGVLSGVNIAMVCVGASEVNLSIVVKLEDLEKAVKLIHKEFFDTCENEEVFVHI